MMLPPPSSFGSYSKASGATHPPKPSLMQRGRQRVSTFKKRILAYFDDRAFAKNFGFTKKQLSSLWVYLAARDDMDWTVLEGTELQLFNTAILLVDGTIISVAAYYADASSPEVYVANLEKGSYELVLSADNWRVKFTDGPWLSVVKNLISSKVKL